MSTLSNWLTNDDTAFITKGPRFAFKTNEEIESLSLVKPPKNTAQSTKWAPRNYETWRSNRNMEQTEKVPENLFLRRRCQAAKQAMSLCSRNKEQQ